MVGTVGVFTMLTVFGVILSVIFNQKNVKKVDDRRRTKAGIGQMLVFSRIDLLKKKNRFLARFR